MIICNRFHNSGANSGKLTSYKGYPSLTPSFKRNLLPRDM